MNRKCAQINDNRSMHNEDLCEIRDRNLIYLYIEERRKNVNPTQIETRRLIWTLDSIYDRETIEEHASLHAR